MYFNYYNLLYLIVLYCDAEINIIILYCTIYCYYNILFNPLDFSKPPPDVRYQMLDAKYEMVYLKYHNFIGEKEILILLRDTTGGEISSLEMEYH